MTLGQNNRVSGCTLVVEHLPPMSKALGVILSTEKPNKQRGKREKQPNHSYNFKVKETGEFIILAYLTI